MQKRGGRAQSRLKPVELDPLAEYGLPSKGEKRLLSHKTQESYYAKIAERYLAFCTEAGDRDGLHKQFDQLAITDRNAAAAGADASSSVPSLIPPPTSPTAGGLGTAVASTLATTPNLPSQNRLAQILDALRKLREAIVASKRRDGFATQVYLFAIRLGVLASSYESYYPALLYLLRVLHHPSSLHSSLTTIELREAAGYLVLDAACRRGDLAGAYALRNTYRLRDAKVDGVLRALVQDDWVLWRRMKRNVDGHRAKIMEFAEPQMKRHLLKAFGRSYLSVDLEVLERQSGSDWMELRERFGVGWELGGNGKVVIRKIQGRT
ncbi:hypothetical protein B0H66DRAFT_221570 [Apodospora peruviana]|uniref:CSN8/PSMD8/EIF3K domain-containing protein n=1 Tax=Apodospora peruviana TaxID=516989 RepID=A0AAE0M4X9_9PEZI|nr:hypothetical protein B0H66DRAFT_221570 [Apodospora peruviana]